MIFISRCHVLPQGGVLSLMVFSKTKSELFLSQPVLSFEKLFQLKELLIADMGNLLKHINLVRWNESGPRLTDVCVLHLISLPWAGPFIKHGKGF